jgi:hypothetical protein
MKSTVFTAFLCACLCCLWTCKAAEKNEPPKDQPRPKTITKAAAEEQARNVILLVQEYAGPGARVVDFHTVAVPGFYFYWVYSPQQNQSEPGYGAAVPAGSARVLTGKDAMRAVLAAKITDPAVLAQLALIFRERGGKLLAMAKNDAQRALGVSEPHMRGNALDYWYLSYGNPITLVHSKVDLRSLEVTTEFTDLPGSTQKPNQPADSKSAAKQPK